jgi:hypothetical protein
MEVEWSVAAAVDDPVIVVPWSDAAGTCSYIDLRVNPAMIQEIPETVQWPEIRSALLLLHAETSGLRTSKCDAWELSDEEKVLDFGRVAFGIGSYIDIMCEQDELFASLERQLGLLKRIVTSAERLGPEEARADLVLRPAWNMQAIGFGTTVYVYGYGDNLDEAREHWATALANLVRVILQETLE